MIIHSLEHEPLESLGNIEEWARKKGHTITRTLFYRNWEFPEMEDFDWLVIMGGSMNIYEEKKYPWLVREKKFISKAISCRKIVLGICLGSQLAADVLGGSVRKNNYRELGWFPVTLTEEAGNSTIFCSFPQKFTAFHCHGDTFSIPPSALRIAGSEACANQIFEYGTVIGLQFHPEYSVEHINHMFSSSSANPAGGKYVQAKNDILSQIREAEKMRNLLYLLLDSIEGEFKVPKD